MRVSPYLIFSLLLTTGCEKNLTSKHDEALQGAASRYVPVVSDCALPHGTVFADCVSNDWFPTYWRSPIHREGGREVRADENIEHYVQVQVLPAEDAGRGAVLDVQYGYQPANASFRFKPVTEQTGFVDLSNFKAGSLQFDIRALNWGFASGLSVNVECGWPCSSEPINIPLPPLGEWRRVEISADELVEQGLDLSRVNSVINIAPTWNQPQGIHYQLDNIRWVEGPASQPLQIEDRNWAKLARLDLDFIYRTALENHPGAIDKQNPGFREYLDGGYEKAIVSLGDVETIQDYANLILSYMAGFNDGHFVVSFHQLPSQALDANRTSRTPREIPDYTPLASIERLAEGVYWVYLPTFLELDTDQREAMHDVIDRLKQLPENSKVVFDVRWNGGGNSAWGWQLLESLYGSSFIRRLYFKEGGSEHYAEFRVSEENANYHKNKAASVGPEHPLYDSAFNRYKGIQNALQEGRDWYGSDSGGAALKWLVSFWYSFGSVESSITPVLVTSDGCASACLDFADWVVRLPNTRHLGLETGSDTLYIDVRFPLLQLPSGLGKLMLPMKVWRERFRDHNESYAPDLTYPGDIYDTKALQQWVLEKI